MEIFTNKHNEAVIFNIQKFSIHDGPGIRTTVFFKGCPLNCMWCHNPESKSLSVENVVNYDMCKKCCKCIQSCENEAISVNKDSSDFEITYDAEKCNLCGECVYNCTSNAREIIGEKMSLDYVFNEVMKDKVFYDESDGGVTVSGGEPLIQSDFVYNLLKKLKKHNIHTAVDTSGFVDFDKLYKISKYTDLFLYDLKIMDDVLHKKYIGVSNNLILENLIKLSKIHKDINIRLIIIDGVNANKNHIEAVIDLLKETDIKKINLLPYHDISRNKYKKLSLKYDGRDFEVPSDEKIKQLKKIFEYNGFEVKIGG